MVPDQFISMRVFSVPVAGSSCGGASCASMSPDANPPCAASAFRV